MDLPRRRSPWRIALSFLLFLGIIVAGLAAWVLHTIDRRWEEFEREVAALVAEADAREGPRPVLRGDPEPGNAWDLYLVASARVQASVQALASRSGDLKEPPELDETGRDLARRHAEAVETLRAGTRRGISRAPWSGEGRFWDAGQPEPIFAEMAARLRGRMLVEAGQARAAADLYLDLGLFNRDMVMGGRYVYERVGLEECNRLLFEFSFLVAGAPLSADDFRAVKEGFERLEQLLPAPVSVFRNERARIGVHLLKEVREDQVLVGFGAPEPALRDWRSLFSSRVRAMRTWRFVEARIREAEAREASPWVDPDAWRVPAERAWESLPEHLKRFVLFSPSTAAEHREVRARLRLLRMACAHRAGDEAPALDDPFGGKFFTRLEGNRFRIWSVGRNAKDEGGAEDDLRIEATR